MKRLTSDMPAQAAGAHISQLLSQHDGDTLCFLAGGSSLDVVAYIENPAISECRTIFMMGDERVSGEVTESNYLQLCERYPDH